MKKLDFSKPIFVIEHCKDCRTHQYCTRHVEKKYIQHAENLSVAIKSYIPEATVLFNQVPKKWYEHDFYC